MPDLLILSRDDQSGFALEKEARERNYRIKTAFDLTTAMDWLDVRHFDILLVDSSLSTEEQQKLAGKLWKLDPIAPFIVYDLDPKSEVTMHEARLFGAEVIRGKSALEQTGKRLERFLKEAKERKLVKASDLRVMVVEDLDSPRDIVCMYIEALGYPEVAGFSSAKSAMAELKQNSDKWSCIVTDIRMPEISGKELIQFIRSDPDLEHLPVIVLTAYGTVDMLLECLKAGATGFLIKPPKKKDLGWELSKALRILANKTSPRLASDQEVEAMRDLLVDRGFV